MRTLEDRQRFIHRDDFIEIAGYEDDENEDESDEEDEIKSFSKHRKEVIVEKDISDIPVVKEAFTDATEKMTEKGEGHSIEFLADVLSTDGKKKADNKQNPQRRVPFEKLFLAYRLCSLTSRCVNFYANSVVGVGYKPVGDEKAIKICQEFDDKVGMKRLLINGVKDMCISGSGWLELMNNTKRELADIQRIDFTKMDFVRDGILMVKEDDSGQPVGYVFGKSPIVGSIDGYSPVVYFTDGMEPNGKKEDIVHFKLFSFGNELPYGFIELVYSDILSRLNLKDSFRQSGYRVGTPLRLYYVGDKPDRKMGYRGHPATKETIDAIDSELSDLDNKHKLVLPFWVKEEISKTETSVPQIDLLNYFDRMIAGGFGLPAEIAAGGANESNADLETLMTRDIAPTLKSMQDMISREVETKIWQKLMMQNGIPIEKTPKMVWNEVIPMDLNRKSKRITQYIQAGVLAPSDVRNMVLGEEELPIKPMPKDEMPQQNQPFTPKIKGGKGDGEPNDNRIGGKTN